MGPIIFRHQCVSFLHFIFFQICHFAHNFFRDRTSGERFHRSREVSGNRRKCPSRLQNGAAQPPFFADSHCRTSENPMTSVDISKAWENGGGRTRRYQRQRSRIRIRGDRVQAPQLHLMSRQCSGRQTRNAGPGCRTGVSYCGGYTR